MQGFTPPPPIIRGVVNWLLVASFTLLGFSAQAALNDTGITTCSNATQNDLPCPVEGFPGQDAEYGTNSFNFTKLDANGNPLPVTATNHSCVKDNVTGLIWEVKTDDGGLRDKDWTYTWYDSNSPDGNPGTANGGTCYTNGRCDTEKFVVDVNASRLCGFTDWRMPNPKEFASIVNYDIAFPGPTIDTSYFPNTMPEYWTNSFSAFDYTSDYSWHANFGYGIVSYSGRNNAVAVRVVHGMPFVSIFQDNGDGTITDSSTGLMWSKCAVGQSGDTCASGSASKLDWGTALTTAKNLTLAGHNDWRLPSVKELQSIVDYSSYNPSINGTYFPNMPYSYFWSCSASANVPADTWFISSHFGHVYYHNRNNVSATRVVRNISVSTAPTVVTNPPCVVTATSARLCGTVNPNNADTTASFDWGTTTDYGTNIAAIPATIDANAGPTNVYADLTGLTCNTTYNYRAKADNSAGTAVGTNQSFKTAACRDLTITNVTLTPAAPVAGVGFNAVITVKNQGTIPTTISKLKLWTNQTAVPTCTSGANRTVNVPALAAGASTTITAAAFTSNTVGKNTFRAFVDGTCVVTESDETNNQRAVVYRVTKRLPDLVITDVTLTPAPPAANGMFNAVITVKNQGIVSIDGGFLDLWTNSTTAVTCGADGDAWAVVGTIAAGASKAVTVSDIPAGAAGAKTLRAFVDSWCEVAESNETNNQLTKSYTVQ